MQAFYIKTFGCKTNQYEEQGIREALLAAGWCEAAHVREAQVLILNTCTVTGQASGNCRRFTGQALRENPRLRLILTGCAADAADDWAAEYPFEAVFPNARKAELARWLAAQSGDTPEVMQPSPSPDGLGGEGAPLGVAPLPQSGHRAAEAAGIARDTDDPAQRGEEQQAREAGGAGFDYSLQRFTGHTRAFLKIQDGCANFCSYCIIPHVRGAPRSRPAQAILQEARQLIAHGYTELVLTGINIGMYEDGTCRLAQLAAELAQLAGLQRLRLGSVEPQAVTPQLLSAMRENERICPHLHLPVQAGEDGILRAMNRRYTCADFLRVLDSVRAALAAPAITTDIITGFPGESEEQFAATCTFAERAAFARAHIFIFSPRQGTPAADLHARTPCPRKIAEERHRILSALCQQSAAAFAQSLCGRPEQVMLERKIAGGWTGYCGRYLRTTVADAPHLRRGLCVPIVVERADGTGLLARPCVVAGD